MPAFGRKYEAGFAPGHTVQDEGTSLTQRGKLNFVGDGVTVTDDSVGGASTVSVLGSGATPITDPRLGVAQGSLLRTYSFDSSAQGWASSAAGGAVVYDGSAGAIRLDPHATNQTHAIDPGPSVTNGEFVADVSIAHATSTTVADAGIVFRWVDDNNYYGLFFRSFHFTAGPTVQLYKRVGGTFTVISEADAISAHELAIGHNARFRVMVRFVGQQISWFINEAYFGGVSDNTFISGGKLGLRVTPGTLGSTITCYQAEALSLASDWQPGLYGSGGVGTAAAGISAIRDEGVAVPSRPAINFVGDGVTATDDAVNGRTIVTIPGAGPAATGAILGVGITKITVSSAEPATPSTGDIWIKRS